MALPKTWISADELRGATLGLPFCIFIPQLFWKIAARLFNPQRATSVLHTKKNWTLVGKWVGGGGAPVNGRDPGSDQFYR